MLDKRARYFAMTLAALAAILTVAFISYRQPPPEFIGVAGDVSRQWPYAIDATEKCWLKLRRDQRPVIRVNCFAIDGVLYTHSNRFAPIAKLLGESWTETVVDAPALEVLIEGAIYPLKVDRVANEKQRRTILAARHYRYIPDGIQVYALHPR